MADHHQPTTTAAALASAAYPRKQIEDSMAFMDEIMLELKAAPDVSHEFLRLLSEFGKHGGDGDATAVESRAAELLRGHPDVLRRFVAYVHMDVPAEGLDLMKPPRRRRSGRDDQQRRTPAVAAPPPNVAAGRNHRGDDGLRLADDAAAQALTFVKRVREIAGPVVYGRFIAVLSEAKGNEDMAADEIYDRAKRAFGPAHLDLLHAFATVWLPGEHEWNLQQARGGPATRQRARAAAAAGEPDAKKPRADARQQRNRAAAASSHAAVGMSDAKKPRADDGNGRQQQHDHVIAVLEVRNVKKRRSSDDDGTGCGRHALHRIGESSGGGEAPPQGRDDDDGDYHYAPRSRAKKPHSGNGEFSSGSAAAARILGADGPTGVRHAYNDNDKKPARRRAATGGMKSSSAGAAAAGPEERNDEVRRFRQEWEFQTCYAKLVATSDRVTELLPLLRTPHGDGGGGGDRSLEALFPLPECREFLHHYYGDRLGEMRAALERGESRVPALEAIERSLMRKEEEAVAEESRKRCRHDPGRVAQRLHGLAMHTPTRTAAGGSASLQEIPLYMTF